MCKENGGRKNPEHFIEFCKIQMDKFRQSRDLEFKINIALWTLIVLFGKFYFDEGFELNICCYLFFSLLIIIPHFIWLKFIHESELNDLKFIYKCRDEIAQYKNNGKDDSKNKWIFMEVVIKGFVVLITNLNLNFLGLQIFNLPCRL